MKSSILGCALLLNLGWLAACGGVSNIGSSDAGGPGLGSGGFKTIGGGSKTGGTSSTGMTPTAGNGPGSGGTPGVGGQGSIVMGGASSTECMADADCTGIDVGCEPCFDGSASCSASCKAGKCVFEPRNCPGKCNTDMDCPTNAPCLACPDGTKACPQGSCLMGSCRVATPSCPTTDQCKGQPCGTPCKLCTPEGGCPMGESFCDIAGKCVLGMTQCSGSCMTQMDCGTPPPNCTPCNDGSCAVFDCVGGKCALDCPNSAQQCKFSEECSMMNTECSMCPNGKCAIAACIQSSCQLVCPVQ